MKEILDAKTPTFRIDEAEYCVGSREITLIIEHCTRIEATKGRLCLHQSHSESVQEMLIAVRRSDRTPPHSQNLDRKSYQVVQGELDVVFFDEQGVIIRTKRISAKNCDLPFKLIFDPKQYHTVRTVSEWAVYLELIPSSFTDIRTHYL